MTTAQRNVLDNGLLLLGWAISAVGIVCLSALALAQILFPVWLVVYRDVTPWALLSVPVMAWIAGLGFVGLWRWFTEDRYFME